jgi:hypothetical protein
MIDDYLWDRTGPPDPEIARLEELLRPLGQQSLPPLSHESNVAPAVARTSPAATVAGGALAAAATIALLVTGGWWWIQSRQPASAWAVTRLAGAPTIGTRAIGDRDRLPVGGSLETNGQSKAAVAVANIGRVEIEPNTRIRLVTARSGDYRLTLDRGTLRANISAPPGQFFVQTPSSLAVDLGCSYTLTIDDEGNGSVRVLIGWVGFDFQGREAFIPAGSVCATRRGVGPGTPYHQRTSQEVRAALDTIDFHESSPETHMALTRVLDEAVERDEVTLWHLLTRVETSERDRVFDRLAHFVAPPSGVTREGIRAGSRDMLDAWWDALGLGSISMWRSWKQQWRDR